MEIALQLMVNAYLELCRTYWNQMEMSSNKLKMLYRKLVGSLF